MGQQVHIASTINMLLQKCGHVARDSTRTVNLQLSINFWKVTRSTSRSGSGIDSRELRSRCSGRLHLSSEGFGTILLRSFFRGLFSRLNLHLGHGLLFVLFGAVFVLFVILIIICRSSCFLQESETFFRLGSQVHLRASGCKSWVSFGGTGESCVSTLRPDTNDKARPPTRPRALPSNSA